MWKTFGHKQITNILEKQLATGRLPHAYLFYGPEGVGKKMLALEFAKKILDSEQIARHPDFNLLDVSGEITVEPTLEFIGKIGFKPFLAAKKVAVINNAQDLNAQSSNALLKTLEEPAENSILILVASFGGVLPTIVSRCQVLRFNFLSGNELKNLSQQQNLKVSEEILALSFGQPSRLIRLCEDGEFLKAEKDSVLAYQQILSQNLGDKFANLSSLAELEALEIEGRLKSWLFWQIFRLKKNPLEFARVSALLKALLGLRQNFNKKLVMQKLFLSI